MVANRSQRRDSRDHTGPRDRAERRIGPDQQPDLAKCDGADYAANKAYYAVRGGASTNELTIIGFGAFSGVANAVKTDRVTLFLSSVSSIGTYQLTSASQAIYTTNTTGGLVNYATDASRTGTVTITKYDLTNGLVSGTFTFSAVSGSAVIAVTEGQFTDVPFGK